MTELEKTSIILPSCENKGNTRVGTARVRAVLPKPIAVRHIRLHNEGESIMKKMEQTLIEPEKFYTIANGNGKVLEVKDYNPDNGAAVQLWDYTGEEWQQWSFVRAGQGVYRICNRFTGKMLDLVACGTADGTWLHQWEGANGSSQLWVLEATNDGRFKVKSSVYGKCVDLVGMSAENGTRAQIWQDVDGENQYWTITEAKPVKKRAARKPAAKKAAETADAAEKKAPAKKATTR